MTQDPFSGLRPPKPSPELRARVMRQARAAAHKPRPGRFERLADRLWDSRPLRVAWLAAAIVLLALNLAGGGGDVRQGVAPPSANGAALAEIGPTGLLRPRPERTLASYQSTAAIEELGL